jgi:SAM-dependent MidA family methyltransferase
VLAGLVERIRHHGPLPFDEFMETALYEPRGGYYERGAAAIGRAGDFYTASDVSSAFGQMLAEQIAECHGLLGEGSVDIVELGAGKGTLAADILSRLHGSHRTLFRRISYWIVDRSSAMRAAQKRNLKEHTLSGKVRWAASPGTVRPDGIVGCVIANEFYDALPVRVVARRDGTLMERRVGLSGNGERLCWVETPATDPELIEYAEVHGAAPLDGSIAEVGLAARSFARNLGRSFRRGFQIVIDYGDRAARLYDPRLRPAGTLMAYHRHQACEDPFLRVGSQDLTAHVNFSALEDAGAEAGLIPVGFTTQDRFLIALGLADRITELSSSSEPSDIRRRLAMMSLIHPEGMGRTFRVLIQAKGIAAETLRGLQDPFAGAPIGRPTRWTDPAER